MMVMDEYETIRLAIEDSVLTITLDRPAVLNALNLESRIGGVLSRSPDADEGGSSFLEKRPACFTMTASSDFHAFYEVPATEPGVG